MFHELGFCESVAVSMMLEAYVDPGSKTWIVDSSPSSRIQRAALSSSRALFAALLEMTSPVDEGIDARFSREHQIPI